MNPAYQLHGVEVALDVLRQVGQGQGIEPRGAPCLPPLPGPPPQQLLPQLQPEGDEPPEPEVLLLRVGAGVRLLDGGG